MIKKLKAILLSAMMMFSAFALTPVTVEASAADYGMYVRNWEIYLSKDGNLYFNFVLGAKESWDVDYTAKLLDSNGTTIASWSSPFTIYAGSKSKFKKFYMTNPSEKMSVGGTYTFRLYGKCLANGKEQSYYWDYTIKYRTDLYDYSSEAYGMGVSYKFYEYDYGDITFILWLSASKNKDVIYRVRLVDPDGTSVYFWNDVKISSGNSEVKYTFSTTGVPVREAGAYKIIVTQIVDYSGLHASYDRTFTYDFN